MKKPAPMRDDPWSGIGIAADHFVGRRVPGEHPLDIYWIKGVDGSPGLLLRGVDQCSVPRQLPKPRGITLEVAPGNDRVEARMFLREHQDREVFLTLCRDVIAYSGSSSTASDATSNVFRRLTHWHSLMTHARTIAMAPHEIRGLIGELCVLERLCMSVGFDAALGAWVAPDDHPQDFANGNRLLEVKARLSGARHIVRISSLQQLEPAQLPLVLVVVELASADGPDTATLNQICARLVCRARELGSHQVDAIEMALFKRGYIQMEAYDADAYRITGIMAFECRDDFPRLVRSEVDARIPEAQYMIDMSLIGGFAITAASVLD